MGEEALRKLTALVASTSMSKPLSFLLAFLFSTIIHGGRGENPSSPRVRPFVQLYPTQTLENILQEARALRYPKDDEYLKILQQRVPESVPFVCDAARADVKWRSDAKPESVHRLRPGDVDVVAAMGDSITCGNGAREFSSQASIIQDRGVSFTGGGIGTWRDITTMPNILKEFNPGLVGYSVGRGGFLSYNAQLNVAIPAAIDDDALNQAKLFVTKMKRHPRVNFTSDWKLLSIFIGHNDVCSVYCFDKVGQSAEAHSHQLQKALDYLYDNVPRLFVNVLSILDPSITVRTYASTMCHLVRWVTCRCLYQKSNTKESALEVSGIVRKYQEAEHKLVHSGRYDGREDFTVELQTFFKAINGPKNYEETENERLIQYINELKPWTPECIHFNQKGMAIIAIALWSNMLEPAGNKTETFREVTHKDIKCPSKEAPYLFTRKNTIDYYNLGHQ